MATQEFLLYHSRTTLLRDAEVIGGALSDILASARRFNEANGLTGVLVYSDGMFFQALEGSTEAIDAAMERIEADRRHEDVRILRRTDADSRLFPDWSMAFVSAAALRESVMGSGLGCSVDITRLPPDVFAPLLRSILTAPSLPNLSGMVRAG